MREAYNIDYSLLLILLFLNSYLDFIILKNGNRLCKSHKQIHPEWSLIKSLYMGELQIARPSHPFCKVFVGFLFGNAFKNWSPLNIIKKSFQKKILPYLLSNINFIFSVVYTGKKRNPDSINIFAYLSGGQFTSMNQFLYCY